MKRGQEYTDYINASFIDVCIKISMYLNCESDVLPLLKSLFKETQSTLLVKNRSFFVWLLRFPKYISYLVFSIRDEMVVSF